MKKETIADTEITKGLQKQLEQTETETKKGMSELESLLSKTDENVSKELLNNEGIELKTDLREPQILEVAKLRFLANRFKISALKYFIDDFLTLCVSKNRLGRKEFISALQNERKEKKDGFMDNFLK